MQAERVATEFAKKCRKTKGEWVYFWRNIQENLNELGVFRAKMPRWANRLRGAEFKKF